MRFLRTFSLCFFALGPAHAEEVRFHVVGDTLYFNGNVPRKVSHDTEMDGNDANELGTFIMEHPEITKIDLRSDGGSTDAAMTMVDSIKRFYLDTQVSAGCYSACAYAFLAGFKRTLKPGGILGFHRSKTSAEAMKLLAERGKNGWKPDTATEKAFDRGIDASVQVAQFLASRGVSADFILKVLATPPREMWMPTRAELAAAGVLK